MINVDNRNRHEGNADLSRERARGRVWRPAVGAAVVAATLTACSSFSGLSGDNSPSPTATASTRPAPASTTPAPASSNVSFASRVKSFFSGDSENLNSAPPQAAAGTPAADIECPSVEYRQGAATMAVNSPGNDNVALGLRYQA